MMGAQDADDPIGALLNLHHVLEVEHNDGDKGNFLFGWQVRELLCRRPYRAHRRAIELLNRVQYSYLEEDANWWRNKGAAPKRSMACGLMMCLRRWSHGIARDVCGASPCRRRGRGVFHSSDLFFSSFCDEAIWYSRPTCIKPSRVRK